MPDTRSASAMVDRERQPELGPNSTVQKRGRNKKTTNKKTPVSVAPSQDLIGANTRADAEANAEIAKLKAQLAESQRLQKDAQDQIAKIAPQTMKGNDHQDTTQAIATLSKPKGEAGDKKNGFNLREAMQLNDAAHKDLYDAIQRSVRTNSIRAGIDFTADYRRQDPAKLASVFKMTRKDHPYMTKQRFPADWSAAEILKQYMKNHRRHAVRNGRMESRAERKSREQGEVDSARRGLPNLDHSDQQGDDSD